MFTARLSSVFCGYSFFKAIINGGSNGQLDAYTTSPKVLSLVPYVWNISTEQQGWKRMFYLNPTGHVEHA